MSFRSIKWLVIAAPLVVVVVLEYSRWALAPMLESWPGRLLMDAVVVVGAVSFYAAVSSFISQLMEKLEQQNRELKALRSASLDINAVLSLDSVLQRIVDQSRALLDCRYGALSVYSSDGRLESFVTSGIDEPTRAAIDHLPTGKGLLRLPLKTGQHLRLKDLREHPYSAGFPANHPEMQSLLAMPVVCREPFRGNLYLSEKADGSSFTAEDEETLGRFAVQAAIAVDNAQLHAKVAGMAVLDERLRLAREMHDGQAQVLAYVNTKAQVVDQLMLNGQLESAREHLSQMAAAAREVYADVREGIRSLRTTVDHDHDLRQVLTELTGHWQDQAGIAIEIDIQGHARYEREAELQLLRVAQEALTNVRKHSRAEKVSLRANLDPYLMTLEVEDNGVGFDTEISLPSTLSHFGLTTMRERCEAIDAELTIRSEPGRGTLVRVVFSPHPMQPNHAQTIDEGRPRPTRSLSRPGA